MPTITDAASDIRVRRDMIYPFLRLISSYSEPSPPDLDLPPGVINNPSFSENQVGPWSIRARTLGASKGKIITRAQPHDVGSELDVVAYNSANLAASVPGRVAAFVRWSWCLHLCQRQPPVPVSPTAAASALRVFVLAAAPRERQEQRVENPPLKTVPNRSSRFTSAVHELGLK